MKKWFGTDPKQFLSLVLLCLRTLILLPLYVHQTCPPRNESRCTSHRWLSPDRFKIYWFASILNQMTMKIRAEFVPGLWRVAKWGSWSCFTREFFEKTPASPVEKGNLQISFFVYKVTGKSWFFHEMKEEIDGSRIFQGEIHESRSPFCEIHASHFNFSLNHASRVNPFTRMQT